MIYIVGFTLGYRQIPINFVLVKNLLMDDIKATISWSWLIEGIEHVFLVWISDSSYWYSWYNLKYWLCKLNWHNLTS